MSDTSVTLLQELTEADAVSGHEQEVRNLFCRRLEDIGAIETDGIGNVSCTLDAGHSTPRILIESHMDEVGFMVQRVTQAGFVKILPLGGWWPHTLLAQRVSIAVDGGRKIPGVIGAPPPHLLGGGKRDKVLAIADLFIDVGAGSKEQAEKEFGIVPGCPVTPATHWAPLETPGLYSAKAFDNRVGVALVIEAMGKLGGAPCTVIGAACVQEEVGTRGAKTLVGHVRPDLAIVLESPPADDIPGFGAETRQGALGSGPQVRLYDPTMIAHPSLASFVRKIAADNGIPHQIAVCQSGGTDAGTIHTSGVGIPTIVLGVPVRYIHSHISVMNIEDYAHTLQLLLAVLGKLDFKTVQSIRG